MHVLCAPAFCLEFRSGPFSPVVSGQVSRQGTETSDGGEASPDDTPGATVDPATAMYHSLAMPGWGQLDNGRTWKAAGFFTAEAICIAGYFYQRSRLDDGNLTDYEKSTIKTDRNTYLIYWFVAKVLGIVDAYVDAQLAGFDVSDIRPPGLGAEETAFPPDNRR